MDREDRDRLVRIETRLENLNDAMEKQVIVRLNDHALRLRMLERTAYVATTLGALALAGVGWLKIKFKVVT